MNYEVERTASGSQGISVIIPSLNSPIIDRVVDAILAQEDVEEIDEIVVIGKDDRGLLPQTSRVRFVDTGEPVNASAA